MRKKDERKIEELFKRIKTLKLPDVPEGWFPVNIPNKNFVYASREREGRVELKPFPRTGLWKKVGEYFDRRNRLLDEIEKTLRKEPEFNVIAY